MYTCVKKNKKVSFLGDICALSFFSKDVLFWSFFFFFPFPNALDPFIFLYLFFPFRKRSAKYQACIVESSSASSTTQSHSEIPDQNSNLQAGLSEQDQDTGTQQDGATNQHDAQAAIEATEDQSGVTSVEQQKPEVMEEERAVPSVDICESAGSTKQDHELSQVQQTKSWAAQTEQCGTVPKPKKDKLARLRELGLVPPPVTKLCADDGAFIQLEPQQANPGEEACSKMLLI